MARTSTFDKIKKHPDNHLQNYYLNINDSRLTRVIRGIQTNQWVYKDKDWIIKVLYEILDQRVKME